MTGKTHRVGGMFCVLCGFSYLEFRGYLLSGVDPVLQLAVMYPFAVYGSIFPDLDHNRNSIPGEDLVSVGVNKILHATSALDKSGSGIFSIFDAKHRSWQTHSDLVLIALLYALYRLYSMRTNYTEYVILLLIGVGFILGVISHLVLDMLTPEGVWIVSFVLLGKLFKPCRLLPKKLSFVPDVSFFRTGGAWEGVVRRILWLMCIVLFLRILYLMSPYRIVFNFKV